MKKVAELTPQEQEIITSALITAVAEAYPELDIAPYKGTTGAEADEQGETAAI